VKGFDIVWCEVGVSQTLAFRVGVDLDKFRVLSRAAQATYAQVLAGGKATHRTGEDAVHAGTAHNYCLVSTILNEFLDDQGSQAPLLYMDTKSAGYCGDVRCETGLKMVAAVQVVYDSRKKTSQTIVSAGPGGGLPGTRLDSKGTAKALPGFRAVSNARYQDCTSTGALQKLRTVGT
jgi:hypothetical protein